MTLFSILPYVRVFLKNYAKSIGFQEVIWSQILRFSYFSFGIIFKLFLFFNRTVASLERTVLESFPTNSLALPSGPALDLHNEREARVAFVGNK